MSEFTHAGPVKIRGALADHLNALGGGEQLLPRMLNHPGVQTAIVAAIPAMEATERRDRAAAMRREAASHAATAESMLAEAEALDPTPKPEPEPEEAPVEDGASR